MAGQSQAGNLPSFQCSRCGSGPSGREKVNIVSNQTHPPPTTDSPERSVEPIRVLDLNCVAMHKRKSRKPTREDWEESNASQVQTSAESVDVSTPDPFLFIQAHEADVIRGPRALSAAHALEYHHDQPVPIAGNDSAPGLVKWGAPDSIYDSEVPDTHEMKQPTLWVDRYDVRLLLDSLLDSVSDRPDVQVRPLSPSGWSDLPSDSEDTFFFSPDELADYRREKRRRLVDRGREERLKALAAAETHEEDPDPWGGSDEEPDETQRELIRRTASHIVSSPNPAQLEMRILANYGADKRFAFLRGRWSRAWRIEKERAKQNQVEETNRPKQQSTSSLGGLAGYGDSDTDGEESAEGVGEEPAAVETVEHPSDTHAPHGDFGDEDTALKQARRARAKEWAARRRAEHSQPEDS